MEENVEEAVAPHVESADGVVDGEAETDDGTTPRGFVWGDVHYVPDRPEFADGGIFQDAEEVVEDKWGAECVGVAKQSDQDEENPSQGRCEELVHLRFHYGKFWAFCLKNNA